MPVDAATTATQPETRQIGRSKAHDKGFENLLAAWMDFKIDRAATEDNRGFETALRPHNELAGNLLNIRA